MSFGGDRLLYLWPRLIVLSLILKEWRFSVMPSAKQLPPYGFGPGPKDLWDRTWRNSLSKYKHILAPQIEEWLSLGHRSVKGNNPNKYSRIDPSRKRNPRDLG